jgi:hypothetical protein
MSIIFDNWNIEICRDMGKLTDEIKRPLLCELEDSGVGIVELVLLVLSEYPLLELINNIIKHMVASGILTHKKKRDFPKEKLLSMLAVLRPMTHTQFAVSDICRRRSVS